MSTPPNDNPMQVETGLAPTQLAAPADPAREGLNVTTGESTRSTSADPLLADKPVLSDTHEVIGRSTGPEAHKFTAPKEDDSSIAKLTTGLGGMAITAPLAGLEKLSPTLAHGVQAVGSSLVDMAHSLTGTGPQYTSAEPIIDTSGLPDANQVASTLSSTAHKVQETVQPVVSQAYESAKPVVANAAQQVHETVKPAATSAAQSIQQSIGGQAPAAATQLAQQPSSRETGVDLSMEPAGARKQVHPVGAGGNTSLSTSTDTAMTSSSTTSTSTGAPAHGYVETAIDAVRGAGNYLSHLLPGPEKQQQMSETAAQGLERAPEVASSAAQSTASGLASAAQTTAAVAGPAASSAASMGATAAHSVAGAATYVAGSVSSAASTATHAFADSAQQAAAAAHLPGWNAPAPTSSGIDSSSSTAAPASAGRGFSSPLEPSTPSADSPSLGSGPMGGSDPSTTGNQAGLIKNYLRDDQASSTATAGKDDPLALTQEADPSTRHKDEDKGFDLRRSHDEPALDKQVSTHTPNEHFSTSASSTSGLPVFSPERASRAHSDTDVDRPTHPGTSSVPSSQAVGTATILSHETIGGPASYGTHGTSSSSSGFAQSSSLPSQEGVGAGFERFAPTAQQSAGGKDERLEGKTAAFMPHKSASSASGTDYAPTRDDMHTPSHVDDSHWSGEPVMSGAGSPRTYSAAHPESGLESSRDAASSFPTSSSTTQAEQHPTFTKAEAEHPPSGGSHAGEAFSSFGPGQPPATGPSAYGGGILSTGAPSSTSSQHLSSAPAPHRGSSDPFHPDQSSSASSKIESTAAKLGSASTSSTSREHHHGQHEHSTLSPSSSSGQRQHAESAASSSVSQGEGVGGLKYTDPISNTTTPASPQTAMPKPESNPHSASPSSSSAQQQQAQSGSSASTNAAGRGAPLAGSTSKTSESSAAGHSTPAWVNKASAERKADYPTHESAAAAAPSSPSNTSSTTGSSAQQSHDAHKPSLKERVKDVFHHSSH
ncbi:uncharacterized protein RHOBADRAFT_53511 [Rhodotorula graminis WP1]|uniref:Proteophosphoglycan ppg4 n=1 Tax=Rhodotorula graminis (strain WP1) TaxID=578459 RepID=A0A194S4U4_RHOGW|nr:uncharacterized protein RHOBADRAFT_53511 [Rhodotorula graminis WP1]KPV75544.1 hypothetical protein RHOBADRAFT_53511 [Rhodotorula graminis WP1]